MQNGWLCWGLTSQSTIFQSCRDGAIASWVINQYFRGVKCLAQGHNTSAVGLEPRTSRSGVRHSTTEPPRSPCKMGVPHLQLCTCVWKTIPWENIILWIHLMSKMIINFMKYDRGPPCKIYTKSLIFMLSYLMLNCRTNFNSYSYFTLTENSDIIVFFYTLKCPVSCQIWQVTETLYSTCVL